MNSILFMINCFVAAVILLSILYFVRIYLLWEYEKYINCTRKIGSYQYKQTTIDLKTIKNNIYELLKYDVVLVPIKISSIRINDNVYQLKYPIMWNHYCELSEDYIRTHYPSIYKCRCLTTIDVCKIRKSSLFYVIYEYENGCLQLIDYDGDIKEINSFCKELRDHNSRIYRMVKFDNCQLFDKCPFIYINPINEKYSIQKHSDCMSYECFRKVEKVNQRDKNEDC